jgi:hypothetical protein
MKVLASPHFSAYAGKEGSDVNELELTLTLKPDHLRAATRGQRVDIIDRVKSAVPSVRYVSGNTNYSVTVSIDPGQERALRRVAEGLCIVAPRKFAESFGAAAPVQGAIRRR